jgi:hypothetical protein
MLSRLECLLVVMCLLTGLSFHGSGRMGVGCPISLSLALMVILFSLVGDQLKLK